MADEHEFTQDPSMPPGWHCWSTGETYWHARPPGMPKPENYVHAPTKQAVADEAWHQHRLRVDAEVQSLHEDSHHGG